MKIRNILLATLLMAFTLISYRSFAQSDTIKFVEIQTIQEEDRAKVELQQNNIDRQNDADALNKEYKAKAKEASRINDEAADAAKQAKRSAKMEEKAQNARERADKQLEKSDKASKKSDKNNP